MCDHPYCRCDPTDQLCVLRQLMAKLDRNALSRGVFHKVALLNHSCHPNCVPEFGDSTQDHIGVCDLRTLENVRIHMAIEVGDILNSSVVCEVYNRPHKHAEKMRLFILIYHSLPLFPPSLLTGCWCS